MPDDAQKLWAESSAKLRYELPREQERNRMSPLELAQLLSRYDAGTPPYILLEHELNLRLAKEQAKATLSAGWIGAGATLIAVFLSAGLGYFAGTSKSEKLNSVVCQPASSSQESKPLAASAPSKNANASSKDGASPRRAQ